MFLSSRLNAVEREREVTLFRQGTASAVPQMGAWEGGFSR